MALKLWGWQRAMALHFATRWRRGSNLNPDGLPSGIQQTPITYLFPKPAISGHKTEFRHQMKCTAKSRVSHFYYNPLKYLVSTWRRHDASAAPTHQSSTLPREIVLHILESLVAEARYHSQALFFSLLSGFWANFLEPHSDSKGEAHLALLCATYLNREWYSLGIELLYKHVVLTSFEDIRLFRRTLRTSPHIAVLIHDVTLAGLEQRIYQRTIPQGRSYRKHLEFVKESLTHILEGCSSTTTFCINIRWPVIYDDAQEMIASGSQTPSNVRKLAACDHTFLPTLAHFAFQQLEVLCLDSYGFRYSFIYPTFPRVHTLQLYDASSHWHEHVFGTGGLHRALPSLRNLEVYNHSADITPMLNPQVFTYPSTIPLQRVFLIESPNLRHLDGCRHWENQINMSEFNLGVLTHSDTSITSWRFPPVMKSLTLIVEIPRDSARVFVLKNIYRCLELNYQSRNSRHLENLTILVMPQRTVGTTESADVESHLISIRDLCETWEINFEFSYISELFCFF